MSYELEFREANSRRTQLGLAPLEFQEVSSRFLANDAEVLHRALQPTLAQMSSELLSRQCLAANLFLRPHVERALGCKAYFTIGDVDLDGRPAFGFSEANLTDWARNGVPDFENARIHSWITLPSFEIFDLTLGLAMAETLGDPRFEGLAITRHHADLGKISFRPVAVGEDVLDKIGARLSFRFS